VWRTRTWPAYPAEAPNLYTMIRTLKWSDAERKAIARKAFERALQQDLEAIIRQAKKMAGRIEQPSDLWELERYLTDRPQRNRSPVRLPLFRPPQRLRRPNPERPPPRTRLTRPVGRKAPTHPPTGPGFASIRTLKGTLSRATSLRRNPEGRKKMDRYSSSREAATQESPASVWTQ